MSFNPYVYPKIYVENPESEVLGEYLIVSDNKACIRHKVKEDVLGRIFSKIMYDNAINEVLDKYTPLIKKSFVVATPNGKYILVEKGTTPIVAEVKGSKVHLAVNEGEEVDEHTRIAYILTRKYETRSIRAGVKGVVVLIGYILGEPIDNYIVVIVGRDHVKYLTIQC